MTLLYVPHCLVCRLFEYVMELGTCVLFTSNRKPTDLYKGGLSRKYFEPFIHMVDRWG